MEKAMIPIIDAFKSLIIYLKRYILTGFPFTFPHIEYRTAFAFLILSIL